MRRCYLFLIIFCALVVSVPVFADTITLPFDTISLSNGLISDSGTLIMTVIPDPVAGAFDVTSLTGDIDGRSISLVPQASGTNSLNPAIDPLTGWSVDDVVYANSNAPFDYYGIMFTDGINYYEFYNASDTGAPTPRVYYAQALSTYRIADHTRLQDSRQSYPATPSVPEPSTLALCGTGILLMAGAMRKKLLTI